MSLIISETVPVDSDRVTGYLVPVGTTVTAVTVYASPHSVDAIIEEVERQARQAADGLTADTRAGRAELASLAHRVARTKTALDDLGKDLVAEWKAKSAAVDAQRRRIREALDALKGTVRAPLTQWELDEEARQVRIAHVLGRLRALAMPSTAPSEAIAAKLADARTMGLDGLEERHHEGVALRAEIVDQLQLAYAVAVERERLEAERQARDLGERFKSAQNQLRVEANEQRQRLQRNFDQRIEAARGDIVAGLLDTLDNLQRAIQAAEKSDRHEADFDALLEGVRATSQLFESKMGSLGLARVESEGADFNPELHEAVEMVPVAPELDNKIILEYQAGYRFGERLVRPARVRVGRAV